MKRNTLRDVLAALNATPVDLLSGRRGPPSASDNSPLKVLPFSELSPALENPLSLVDGTLGPGGLSILYGPPGAGKSFLATYLSCCIATEKPFFRKAIEQVGVLYFAAESPRSIEQRFYAYKQSEGIAHDIPLGVVPSTISIPPDAGRMIAAIRAFSEQTRKKVGFIVIDTLSRASAGSDENSAQDASSLVKSLDHVREITGVHVMIVTHAAKDPTKSAQGPRGSSVFRAAADTEIFVEAKAGGHFTARVTKQRDAEIGETFTYDLNPICIGTDPIEGEYKTPIVRELQSVREVKPLKGRKKLAFELLKKLSTGESSVAKADWQTEFLRSAHTKGGPDEKSLARDFRKVAAHLRTTGYIQENGENVAILEGGP